MESYAQLFQTLSGNVALYAAALLATLFLTILVHEFGHYLTARLFGVRIDKFSLGFGKEIKSLTDKAGTRWTLSQVPLGGYVLLFGDVDPAKPLLWDFALKKKRPLTREEERVAFYNKPLWQRTLIVVAGPLANFFLTFLILFLLFVVRGEISTPPVVTAITKGSAAQEAGFKPYDRILSIDGKAVDRFEDVWLYTMNKTGVPYTFKIDRRGKTMALVAASRPFRYRDERGVERAHGQLGATHINGIELKDLTSINGTNVQDKPDKARKMLGALMGRSVQIGFGFDDEGKEYLYSAVLRKDNNREFFNPGSKDCNTVFLYGDRNNFYYPHTPWTALGAAVNKTGAVVGEGIRMIVTILGGHSKGSGTVAGIGKITGEAGKAAQAGWYSFMLFVAAFSAQIAFINLFPIPALDGGYLLFYAYEAVAGRPLPESVKTTALYLGLAFLFGIIIIANINDVFLLTRR